VGELRSDMAPPDFSFIVAHLHNLVKRKMQQIGAYKMSLDEKRNVQGWFANPGRPNWVFRYHPLHSALHVVPLRGDSANARPHSF
jgi:hypothetical protein